MVYKKERQVDAIVMMVKTEVTAKKRVSVFVFLNMFVRLPLAFESEKRNQTF